jgi:TRAP-type C4-dicarboxylate transport system permease small subunit
VLESICLIAIGIYLLYTSFNSNESALEFGVATKAIPELFKFLNLTVGLILCLIGFAKILHKS